MSKLVQLEVPEEVERLAREVATQEGSNVENVLTAWLEFASSNIPVHLLPDAEVLKLSRAQMTSAEQDELWQLLSQNNEGGELSQADRIRLDALMQIYRGGMLRKAEALKVAVLRGLRPPLDVE